MTVDQLYEDVESVVDSIVGYVNVRDEVGYPPYTFGDIREMVRQAYRWGLKDAEDIENG